MADWLAPERVAVVPLVGRRVAASQAGMLDHAAFCRHVDAWQAAFAARNGRHWAVFFEDASEFAACLYGAWHAGKVPYLCGDTLPATLDALASCVAGFAGDFPAGCEPLGAIDGAGALEREPLDAEATELVVFTSGTTGEPAAIAKRLSQLSTEVAALEASFGEGLGDAAVHGTVSHQHIYGLLFRVLWPLAAGRTIMPRTFFPEQFAGALSQAPGVLVASPAHLKRLPDAIDWAPVRRMVRAVFSSGGALPADAAFAVRERMGLAPFEVYGSSETGGIAWRCEGVQDGWKPLPGVEWRIAEGHLEIRSPHLPAADWWRSEDLAETDGDDGFLLRGRADRIAKVEERRVSLTGIERALLRLDEVEEARVLVLGGARELLAAVVVPSAVGAASLAVIGKRAFSRRLDERLAASHDAVTRPHRWRFVDALPLNAQGKVTAAALTALFRPESPAVEWVRRDASHAEALLRLDASLAAFDGHFPQAPVLPGVAQLDWAIRLGREAFALPSRMLRLEALKFQQIARPGMQLHLKLDWHPDKAMLAFLYESQVGTHASGRVVFRGDA